MTKKQILKRINRSKSLSHVKEDILTLATHLGMKDTVSAALEKAVWEFDYDLGMVISKLFDICGVVPSAEWLNAEVKWLYESGKE